MIPKISTGINFLDEDLGGFYSHRIFMFNGDNAPVKLTLAAAYANRGLELGEVCLWLTPQKPEDLFIQLAGAQFNFMPFIHNGMLSCIEYVRPNEMFTNYFIQYTEELRQYIKQHGVERVVFEASQLLFMPAGEFRLPEYVSLFTSMCDDLNISTLLLLDKPEDPYTNKIQMLLSEKITGVLSVDRMEDRGRPFNRLDLKKLTGRTEPYTVDFTIKDGHDFCLLKNKGINWART